MASPERQDTPRFQYEPLQGNEIRLIDLCPSRASMRGTGSLGNIEHCNLHHYPLVEPATTNDELARLFESKSIWDASNRKFGARLTGHTNQTKSSFAGLKKLPLIRKIRRSTANGRFPWGDYVALSYTWGDPPDIGDALVNGQRVKVRSNLEYALSILREKAPIQAGVKIWVDALCIDQMNTEEKDLQVPRMREIYQKALNVVVWLGDEEDYSSSGMRLIRVLADSWRADKGVALAKAMVDSPLSCFSKVKPAPGPMLGCWQGLRDLMRRPYWKRVWVVQELAMGGRKSLILCGEECIDFGQLCDATASWMSRHSLVVTRLMLFESSMHGALGRYCGTSPALNLDRNDGAAVVDQLRRIVNVFRGVVDAVHPGVWVLDSDRITFIESLAERVSNASIMCAPPANLIVLGRASEASNPQDKIYGFLSLIDPNFVSQFKVDYKLSAAEVYTSFSVYWMKHSQTLDLFIHCFLEHGHSPSWVPDWNNSAGLPVLYIGEEEDNYQAGGKVLTHFEFSEDLKRVKLLGMLVDQIDGLTAADDEKPEYIVQATTAVRGSFEEVRDELWRTFIGNRDLNNSIPPTISDTGTCEACSLLDVPLPLDGNGHLPGYLDEAFYKFITTNQAFMINNIRLDHYFVDEGRRAEISKDERPDRGISPDIYQQMVKASLLVQTRRLATTIDGRIGLVPRATKKGDVVTILIGCPLPVVLRLDGDSFKVVGTCYLHGVMEGELYTEEILEAVLSELTLS